MHLQLFEVVANILAVVVLIAIAAVHVYGRRRFEEGGSRPDPEPQR